MPHKFPFFSALRDELDKNLFGQHIVLESVLSSLRMHFQKKDLSSKPLVISFHGMPGTGKNYVADFIAKSLYKKGLDSKYVHKFFGRLEFPEASKATQYGVRSFER
jgi:torsin-1